MATNVLNLVKTYTPRDLAAELGLMTGTRYVVQISGGNLSYSEAATEPDKNADAQHTIQPSASPDKFLTVKIDAANKPWVWATGAPVKLVVTEAI